MKGLPDADAEHRHRIFFNMRNRNRHRHRHRHCKIVTAGIGIGIGPLILKIVSNGSMIFYTFLFFTKSVRGGTGYNRCLVASASASALLRIKGKCQVGNIKLVGTKKIPKRHRVSMTESESRVKYIIWNRHRIRTPEIHSSDLKKKLKSKIFNNKKDLWPLLVGLKQKKKRKAWKKIVQTKQELRYFRSFARK